MLSSLSHSIAIYGLYATFHKTSFAKDNCAHILRNHSYTSLTSLVKHFYRLVPSAIPVELIRLASAHLKIEIIFLIKFFDLEFHGYHEE